MTPIDIARLEEARQAKSTAEIVEDAEPITGGWMAYDRPGSWANQACGLGLNGPVTDNELDSLVHFYASRGVEPRIEVCPFADHTLIDGLARRGFQLVEFENVLARDLSHEPFPPQVPHGWPEPLKIELVDAGDPERAQNFIEVSTSGFRPLDKPLDPDVFETTRRMIAHPRTEAYLATRDGVSVGGGAMEAVGPIACLFSTSVLPNWRRRGVQAALIVRRLERARERGCDLGIIHSSPGETTERNAFRLGFRVAYTKVIMVMPGAGLMPSS